MDPNSTGRQRLPGGQPTDAPTPGTTAPQATPDPAGSPAAPAPTAPAAPGAPAPAASLSRSGRRSGYRLGRGGIAGIGGLALLGLVAAVAVAGGGLFAAASASPSRSESPLAAASATSSLTPRPTPNPPATAADSPTPTPQPTAPQLPALLGAIGDSYTQAWSVSPAYRYDHPQFSWAVGTSKTDGVTSLFERFRALGASPVVVDAATSGRTMDDASRQADLVMAAAKKLAAGKTAYVTFELGTNDLCASPNPMTDIVDFQVELRTALNTLRTGLPAGSRILMLSVPDFPHFHDITEADAAARAKLAAPPSAQCAPYLGTNGPSSVTEADALLAQYDAALKGMCDDIDAKEGQAGKLYCTYNASLLAESDFTLKDLSTYDYFHPSLSGQAKMAEDAWKADVWASLKP